MFLLRDLNGNYVGCLQRERWGVCRIPHGLHLMVQDWLLNFFFWFYLDDGMVDDPRMVLMDVVTWRLRFFNGIAVLQVSRTVTSSECIIAHQLSRFHRITTTWISYIIFLREKFLMFFSFRQSHTLLYSILMSRKKLSNSRILNSFSNFEWIIRFKWALLERPYHLLISQHIFLLPPPSLSPSLSGQSLRS